MSWWITWLSPSAVAVRLNADRGVIRVGRGPFNDIILTDESAFRRQLEIRHNGMHPAAVDVSGRGFRHNGSVVFSAAVAHGDELEVGGTVLKISETADDVRPWERGRTRLDGGLVQTPGDSWKLELSGDGKTRTVELTAPLMIGSDPACGVLVLDDFVSRRHCAVEPRPGGVLVRDLSKNAEELKILRSVGYSSVIMVPLKIRNRVRGCISLVNAESRRRFDESDLALGTELAHRVALAIENSEIYEELRRSELVLREGRDTLDAANAKLVAVNCTAPLCTGLLDA